MMAKINSAPTFANVAAIVLNQSFSVVVIIASPTQIIQSALAARSFEDRPQRRSRNNLREPLRKAGGFPQRERQSRDALRVTVMRSFSLTFRSHFLSKILNRSFAVFACTVG